MPLPSVAKKLAELVGSAANTVTTYTGTVQQVGSTYQVLIDGATVATTCTPEVKAVTGDRVTVEVRNHMATVRGNITHPTTDDARAEEVLTQAEIAADAATAAQSSAGDAATAATNAASSASTASGQAAAAAQSASTASQAATTASSAATAAQGSAAAAEGFAESANTYATDALVQLSVVQSVIDTLAWISEHGTYELTEDGSVDPRKAYFVLVDGMYESVKEPTDDDISTYYELVVDDAVSNYVASHVSLTDDGLWVVPDATYSYAPTEDQSLVDGKGYYQLVGGKYVLVDAPDVTDIATYYERATDPGYRVLVGHGSVAIVDPDGRYVTKLGESIEFDSERPQRIGGDDAYVEWVDTNDDGVADTLRIAADSVTLGGVDVMRVGDTSRLEEDVAEAKGRLDELDGFISIRPSEPSIELGSTSSPARARIDDDSLDFTYDGTTVASIGIDDSNNGSLLIDHAQVRDGGYIQLGSWQWVPRSNGNVALKWVGGDA